MSQEPNSKNILTERHSITLHNVGSILFSW